MNKGFTLVELSIVLVIIGLLVGGILATKSMIASAKVNRVITEYQQYEIMVNQFKQNFQYLPGDNPNGYATNPFGDGNGNGDGVINYSLANVRESAIAWIDLKTAGYLRNCTCNGGTLGDAGWSTPTGTTPPSSYDPKARWGIGAQDSGTYSMYHFQGYGLDHNTTYFLLTQDSGQDGSLNWTDSKKIKALDAYAIDKKIDDGKPKLGDVQADNTSVGASGAPARDYPGDYRVKCLDAPGSQWAATTAQNYYYYTQGAESAWGCVVIFKLHQR